MYLTEKHIDEFQLHGIIKLEKFIPHAIAEEARKKALLHFTDRKFYENGTWNFASLQGLSLSKANSAFRKPLSKLTVFNTLISREIWGAAEELIGETPHPLLKLHPLCSIPDSEIWSVPATTWHMDLPNIPNRGFAGIQMFTFLNDVQPTGGGTLAVAGSHHLLSNMESFHSKSVKENLKREVFFRKLMSKEYTNREEFLKPHTCLGNVQVKVIEMYGSPGDVYFMDLRILHTVAPNSLTTPRLMATQRFATRATLADLERAKELMLGRN